MRRIVPALLALFALAGGLLAWMHAQARADPVVRRLTIGMRGWPAETLPVRAVLLGDVHLGNATTDAARLHRIVAQVNALQPDVVLIAGDLIAGSTPGSAAKVAEPLARELGQLRAAWGTVAVLGNHDYWTGAAAVRAALARAHIAVLENGAAEVGPLAIGGVADAFTHRDDVAGTMRALRRVPGIRVLLSHSPDIAPRLPADAPLLLAGHTHCGQVMLPLIGAPVQVALPRYRCGAVRDGGRLTVVTAGTGTSDVPLRLGAPPDLWLLTLGPAGDAPPGPAD